MKRREIAWLHEELPRLVGLGVLDAEAAGRIARHYGPPGGEDRRGFWTQVLLASFGAVLIGGGLLLVVAHNWDELGRSQRAALLLATLLAAQALALFAHLKRPDSTAWREATAGLLVAAAGAAVSLIGQTYHIPGTTETFYRTWLWLIVLVPYLTGSRLAAIGFWFILLQRMSDWRPGEPGVSWEVWALLAVAMPFVAFVARHERESWATLLVVFSALVGLFATGGRFMIEDYLPAYAVMFLAGVTGICAVASLREPPGLWTRWKFPSVYMLAAVSLLLTFKNSWRALFDYPGRPERMLDGDALLTRAICFAIALITMILLARRRRPVEAVWVSGGLLAAGCLLIADDRTAVVCTILFNVWLAVAGIVSLLDGLRSARLGTANLGLAALSLLIMARFFDTDLTLLQRGLAFIVIGCACLAVNVGIARRARLREKTS